MSLFNLSELDKIEAANKKGKAHRILIVDDEPDNLLVLKGILGQEYDVVTAADGAEALKLLESDENPEKISLIITDQRMPNLSGVEFLERSIAVVPSAIKIILSAYTDVDVIIDGINKGHIYHFITKPYERGDILLTVKRALETHELEQENRRLVVELKVANEKLEENNQLLEARVKERTRQLEQTLELQNQLNEMVVDANSKLAHLATIDSLTDVYNRRHFMEIAERFIASSEFDPERTMVLMLDIDHFKQVNDRFGHDAGDETLGYVAGILKSLMSERDIIGRLGGEEFAIVLRDADHTKGAERAELIRRDIESLTVQAGEDSFGVTVSLGLAGFTGPDFSLRQALKNADLALYMSKENGRNKMTIGNNLNLPD